jgi:hypothetical protein
VFVIEKDLSGLSMGVDQVVRVIMRVIASGCYDCRRYVRVGVVVLLEELFFLDLIESLVEYL